METLTHLMTKLNIPRYHPGISYNDHILMTGSCFAEHMEHKLSWYKYQVYGNPFGILYNPESIAHSFERIINLTYYTSDELVQHDDLYHSMDHHGSFSGPDQTEVLKKINETLHESHAFIQKTEFAFISLGTSRVYAFKPTGRIAGNNHKIPSSQFEARHMSVTDTKDCLQRIYDALKQANPAVHIIWTISPVRHLKDGLIENQRSKAVLILAVEQFIQNHPDTQYFPAYEIMVDQLRDYRFYARDMVHPSDIAIDIIWETLAVLYLDPHGNEHHAAIDKVRKAAAHRMLHDNPTAITAFARAQLKSIDHLAALYPEMDWKEERQYFFQLIEPD